MYNESDYLMLSGIQHYRFCPRQCALIHLEQLWAENFLTAHGEVLHEKVHSGIGESRKILRTERDLPIFSSLIGITGKTDAVEFYRDGKIIPIEYKHGSPKAETEDEVQLCAQVICLEEMLGTKIDEGAIFYFKVKKRVPVRITDELRKETFEIALKFHQLMESNVTPKAEYSRKCESCSLIESCFPENAGKGKSVSYYLERRIKKEPNFEDEGQEEN